MSKFYATADSDDCPHLGGDPITERDATIGYYDWDQVLILTLPGGEEVTVSLDFDGDWTTTIECPDGTTGRHVRRPS